MRVVRSFSLDGFKQGRNLCPGKGLWKKNTVLFELMFFLFAFLKGVKNVICCFFANTSNIGEFSRKFDPWSKTTHWY